MAALSAKPGPARTPKTPKRVRFAGEDRERTKIIRYQEAKRRDARSISRVDVDVTTSYDIPLVSAAVEAIYGFAKSTIGNVVEFGKTTFTSSFEKVIPTFIKNDHFQITPTQQQASMLEYPPFLAGATPNVVKRNRKDYYQSLRVRQSIEDANSYASGSVSRTPEDLQSDKEKNWYRFHETPYSGHKLDFALGRPLLPPTCHPEYRFETPLRVNKKTKPPKSATRSSKKQQRSALKRKAKLRLGEVVTRQSNAQEFHSNFAGRERNEVYASYTRFLTSLRFDVKMFAQDLRELTLPTTTILEIHDTMKRADWDFFVKIMADEEYWAQVKGVGSTKVPIVLDYMESQPKRSYTNPCEYCKPYDWSGKVEVRELENEGDEVPIKGYTKFDVPYTQEEQGHIDSGRFHMVFHRFCHESRYDWAFPDPSRPSSWEGQNHPAAIEVAKQGKWQITKYDPRLRHFPLLMQRVPKRMRQVQQDLYDTVHQLSLQDRASWLYIQGIRRHNTSMAKMLERIDLERKRRQVLWPCQLQVKVRIQNSLEPKSEITEPGVDSISTKYKRIHGDIVESMCPDTNGIIPKKARFQIDKPDVGEFVKMDASPGRGDGIGDKQAQPATENPIADFCMGTKHGGVETEDTPKGKKVLTKESLGRMPSGSFGLFSDDETEDEKLRQKSEMETGAKIPAIISLQEEQPKWTWLQKLDATMKAREAELAAQEIERAKAEAEEAAKMPPTPKQSDAVPPVYAKKPIFPAVESTVPAPAPKKPFVFEDPSQTQEQPIPTNDEYNPLKEHTNGVKPSPSSTNVPNLFGSVVPSLAPPGPTSYNCISPFKPIATLTSATAASRTVEAIGFFGNEENMPTTTAGCLEPTSAPLSSVLAAPALVAPASATSALQITPKTQAPTVSLGPVPPFSFTAPSSRLFLEPSPASVDIPQELNKPLSIFSQKGPRETAISTIQPMPTAPSVFTALSTVPASGVQPPTVFKFGTESALAQPTLFTNAAPKAPASIQLPKSIASAPAGHIFGKSEKAVSNTCTQPPPAPLSIFSKPAVAQGSFPSHPTAKILGSEPAPPVTIATSTAPIPGIFGKPSPSNVEVKPPSAPAITFRAHASAVPKADFGEKPPFIFEVHPKPTELATPTSLFSTTTTLVQSNVSTAPSIFSFNAASATSAPVASAPVTSEPATSTPVTMAASFPTSSTPLHFIAGSTAPVASMSASFPPATPAQLPPYTFKLESSTSPAKASQLAGTKFNEDISMASPEQSPEKPSSTLGIFGTGTNGISTSLSSSITNGNSFAQNKPFSFASMPPSAPPVPSLGKFTFGGNASQTAVCVPPTTAPLVSATTQFGFTGFTGMPGAPVPTSTIPPPAAPVAAPTSFQFDTASVDFSLPTAPARKFATPRPKRFGKR